MNRLRRAAGAVLLAAVLAAPSGARAQEIRRAQPLDAPPIPRALPVEESPAPVRRAPAPPSEEDEVAPDEKTAEQPSDKRQLEYANALFGRKMYDLAIPEYERFLADFPHAAGRANALFGLAESYRQLGKTAPARSNFQKVLDENSESEFAGPAAYALAVLAFGQKDFASAQPLFHRAAVRTKDPNVALSARYFEARCLESLKKTDEALALYLQIVQTKSQYREDARTTAAALLLARGKKAEALKQYEGLANEAEKPAARAEAAVRAGLIAVDLAGSDRGKIDKEMADKARVLLQKGRAVPDAGRWRGLAQAGLLRLQFQTGQFATVISEYKKNVDQLPDEAKAEAMLLVANAQRQLGQAQEAETIYRQLIEKYPSRDEAKEARYQRLVNLYNSNANSIMTEVDGFLQSNPSPERADQAKLLEAEALYKQGRFADAAPLYEALRASQLTPKLRAEAAYKLGWCYIQLKDPAREIEAFSHFLKTFPDDPQVPLALTQRALAYQQNKKASAAIDDLSLLITKYPGVKEREGALQQKALLLGEMNRAAEMAQTFQQLLKEYPKSAAAAQANYYIGKAAFDAKDYKRALAPLETARRLNRTQYYNLATLRLILSHFYLHDRKGTSAEVDAFLNANAGGGVPAEVLEWLGIELYNQKNFADAAKYLTALAQVQNAAEIKPDYWFYLGDACSKLQKWEEADAAFTRYLQTSTDPAGKAKALLALGATKIAAHKPDEAEKIAAEIMHLQPEGKVNAEARLLAGDVQFERARFDEAGKAYAGVALLYDDPTITPRALDKAASAYRRAGRTDEADRVAAQLHERYPNYAGG